MPVNQEKEQPRRRQARGERRIAQLLEAAATVFCSTGYAAASTNAIAREAGVSPGTLYQFFPNKEAIAIELSGRLMHEMRETYGEALAPVDPATPLEEAVAAAVDRFIDFNCRHPVVFTLMHGPDVPGRIAEQHDAVHAALLARIETLLTPFLPDASAADISRTAHVCVAMYKAGLELVLTREGEERAAYVQELKNVLFRYLEPLAGGDCTPGSPAGTPAPAAPAP
ncbi:MULTISPECIES: TetR/AcrR family transcriptional regulator [Streptomyces]|uniref:Putative TetR family regulator n=1 Tax=Streptomyces scabiei (strain 87.22) TaxID=680198 RepID=C9Z5S1_STRSW|nr:MULTISPECIES: TetR/AcrR family transcriptional regulator [Streptomyces]MBP5863616.1 TetR/AcrR family transcriptional regulator [Streptomyces sp. LBUM 1484]MBP5867411.1 TetR/AcrR family transcriptional regulator [Streptomyces sp. LBUM 1485]MBP5906035.1 TetR/AcrR family transcriptional regulator [Streptomyces sp. LBUM 1478]MBP5931413.1 TetR/AcrR family transcriptional regulator [Streptomyces sp. LBUM 1479]KFG03221.1 TetR family transcriptional regulator [Streptomyces scabiei]